MGVVGGGSSNQSEARDHEVMHASMHLSIAIEGGGRGERVRETYDCSRWLGLSHFDH